MPMAATAARIMKLAMTPLRRESQNLSEIQPLVTAPSAIPMGSAMLIHLPSGSALKSSPRK